MAKLFALVAAIVVGFFVGLTVLEACIRMGLGETETAAATILSICIGTMLTFAGIRWLIGSIRGASS